MSCLSCYMFLNRSKGQHFALVSFQPYQRVLLGKKSQWTFRAKVKMEMYLAPGGLQTEPPWLFRSPALDTLRWQPVGSSCHHRWFPTLRSSAPPLGPHLRWPRHEGEPEVAAERGKRDLALKAEMLKEESHLLYLGYFGSFNNNYIQLELGFFLYVTK